jgi:integral membrane sensor domain MASE1
MQLSAAAAYFGLDDSQKDTILGGYIMAAFFAVGAPAALLVRPQHQPWPGDAASTCLGRHLQS